MPIYQQSVFGEVTYNITDPWAVTIGARRYHYDAPVSIDQYGSLTSTVMTSTSEKDQGVTPKASMSYQFTKDLMVYATAAKGFRPGGGTGPVPTSGPTHLRSPADAAVRYFGVRPRPDLVQVGQHMELRGGREADPPRQSHDCQWFDLFREMERCAADQRAFLMRLRVHGQYG